MITKTLTQLLAGVRAARGTVETPVTLIPDAELTDWINEHIRSFWEAVAPICRDEFTSVTGTLTIAGGASTLDLGSLIPTFLAIRGVDRAIDANAGVWRPLRPFRMAARNTVCGLMYHMTGKTLRFVPTISAPGDYRVWFIPVPLELSGVLSIDLPYGGDTYVIQGAAAQLRARMEEDPAPHLALQDAALRRAQHYIMQHNQGDQEAIADVYGDDWDF